MTTPEPEQTIRPNNKKRNRAILWLTFAIILCILLWIIYWFVWLRFSETTDDAYVGGNMVDVTVKIAGTPIAFYADDTDLVQEGQLLVLMDTTDFTIEFEKQKASLALAAQEVRELWETVKESQATLEIRRIQHSRAQYDYNNRQGLVDINAVSKEDYTHSRDDLTVAEQSVKVAEHQLMSAIAALGSPPVKEHPKIRQAKENVKEAYVNLRRCKVLAPTTGYVAKRNVQVGDWITPTRPLMSIIPLDNVWVDANYKETQLENIRIGQPVELKADIYGSDFVYKGEVVGFQPGSGSAFSLIPPQNATGNWIKIVQRIPVRIKLHPEQLKKFPLLIGLSVYVDIDTTNRDGKRLATTPANRVVCKTEVFEFNYNELNFLMDQIVDNNLLFD